MQVLIAILVAVLVALGAPVSAAAKPIPEKPILVIESHVGARPAEMGRVMDVFREVLEPRGFAVRPAEIRRLTHNSVPRPGVLDPDLTAVSIMQHLDDGWEAFVAARWEEAITKLTKALDEVHRNPALVVNDTSHLDRVFKAYVALAVIQQRRAGARGAALTMIEVIRMFPSRSVAADQAWGREGEKLHGNMATRVQKLARGRLSIASGQPEAAIFVDGQLRGQGNAELAELVPGIYRVFVRPPGSIGRQYEVVVAPSGNSRLEVDLDLDMTVWATDSWVGFQRASEEARAQEGKLAIEVARRWVGRGTLVLLATGQDKGRPVLVGARYRDGLELRRARVYSDDPGSASVLARYLLDGTLGPGLEVLGTEAVAPPPRGSSWREAPTVVLSVGVLSAAGSVVAYFGGPESQHRPPTHSEGEEMAVGLFVGSSFVVGAGVYLYLRETRSSEIVTAAALGTGVAALLSGIMLYGADQDPITKPGLYVREFYRDTAPAGLLFGGVGLALTGVAAWWELWHERPETGAPIVTVERGGGLVGWTGRF